MPMGRLTSFIDEAYPRSLDIGGLADPAFSLDTAQVLAWAAQLAYEATPPPPPGQPTVLDRMARQWGWGPPHSIQQDMALDGSHRMARGYIVQAGGVGILAFCGTEPDRLSDWRIDFDFLRHRDGVSRGVRAALDKVWSEITSNLAATTGPVLICGHSLGGAFAVLAAQKLATTHDPAARRLRAVYTFGMPRIGNIAFVTLYNNLLGGRLGQSTYRLVHGVDLVPRVPPAGTGRLQFRHVGRALACGSGERFEAPPGPPVIESTDGNLTETLRLLDDSFASWDRLVATLGYEVQSWLPESVRSLLPAPERPPSPPFPARYPEAKGARFLLPAFRDHLMDGYLRALGVVFPTDGI